MTPPTRRLRGGVTVAGDDPITDIGLDLPDRRVGKVRVSYALGDGRRLMITTDRVSALDRVVGAVPHKGQALLSFWG